VHAFVGVFALGLCAVMLCCSDHYSQNIRLETDLILPACGEVVVVRYAANERWYRAMVLGTDFLNNVKVGHFFVLNFSINAFSLRRLSLEA